MTQPLLLEQPSKLSLYIDKIGYTKYHLKLLLMTFIVFGLDGFHLTLSSNMIIPFQSYYNMNVFWLELSSGIIFLGIAISSLFLKNLISLFGNRLTLFKFGIIVINLGHLMSILINDKILFSISRFLCGIGLGVAQAIILSITCESIPLTNRAVAIACCWVGYSVCQGLCCIVMIILMPNYESEMTPYVLFVCFVLLLLASLYCYFELGYSPENLVFKGKYKEAFKMLQELIHPAEITEIEFNEFKKDLLLRKRLSK